MAELATDAWRLTCDDVSQTQRLGQLLAESLPAGAVVGLIGTLGAGKTLLTRAIAESLGVAPQAISSPTFVLVHEYQGVRPVYHFDVYRLKDEDEFLNLGPEEYFYSAGISLVEWADRVLECLPRERLLIRLEPTGANSRSVELIATGAPLIATLERLRAAWPTG